MKTWLLVFIAGGSGTLCRFLACEAVVRLFGRGPWGTMTVNVLGCLLFGLVSELAWQRHLLTDATRLVLCTGFLGGFTTFSSLIFDSFVLGQKGMLLLAANILVQVLAGFAALFAGMQAARLF